MLETLWAGIVNEYELWKEKRRLRVDQCWNKVHTLNRSPPLSSFLVFMENPCSFMVDKSFLYERVGKASKLEYFMKRIALFLGCNLLCTIPAMWIVNSTKMNAQTEWERFWWQVFGGLWIAMYSIFISSILCHYEKFFSVKEEILNYDEDEHSKSDSIHQSLELKECKVCHESYLPLLSPCRCAGTMKYIHEECLEAWRRTSPKNATYCVVCKTTYKMGRNYKSWKEIICWLISTSRAIITVHMWQSWLKYHLTFLVCCFLLERSTAFCRFYVNW